MQFDVYINPTSRMRDRYPLVVDVQSNLLFELPTRMAVPLGITGVVSGEMPRRLCPVFAFEQRDLIFVPFIAAPLARSALKSKVGSLKDRSHEIIAAMDAVLAGL